MPSAATESLLITPTIAFAILLVIYTALTFTHQRWSKALLPVFDFVLFLSLGLVGVLLLFMWFGTDHALCANNYNLLWAIPTNLVAAFFVHKNLPWVKKYFRILFWITILLLLTWFFLPQRMNNGFLPLVLTIALRSWMLSNRRTYADKRI